MSQGVLCRQDGCTSYAAAKYTWPGKDQSAICAEHVKKLAGVAQAIGLPLQLRPISDQEHQRGALDSEGTGT